MDQHNYKLLSSEGMECELRDASEAEFFGRVRLEAENPHVSVDQLIDLIYGCENPILTHGVLPGRGLDTKELFARALYHVMLDLLSMKTVQQGGSDPTEMHSKYTMRVSEAADRLGISPGAVRQAISARRLRAIEDGGQWLLSPEGVESYIVSSRGRSGPLDVCIGNAHKIMYKLRYADELEDRTNPTGSIHQQLLPGGWKRVALLCKNGDAPKHQYAFVVIEPAANPESIEDGSFYIRGRFKKTIDIRGDDKRANEAFKAFWAR